ncbi:MAG: cell division protein FtsB [Zoogloeaceae bacterium]|jgi:cell division protein FtsB|nr:cell division protein FtsB [Zoogloeaceae bacterium]
MRPLTLFLLVFFLLLQYPLWFGESGWLKVWEYGQKIERIQEDNSSSRERNAALQAETRDLKSGYEAVEEGARVELGMIREGEVFIPFTEETPDPDSSESAAENSLETGGKSPPRIPAAMP